MAFVDPRRGSTSDLESGYGKEDGMMCFGIDNGKLNAISLDYVENEETKRAIMKMPTIQLTTAQLTASSWSNGRYSFESTYSFSDYDLNISLAESATDTQLVAFSKAQIIADDTENTLIARGAVPTVNIPVKVEVRSK